MHTCRLAKKVNFTKMYLKISFRMLPKSLLCLSCLYINLTYEDKVILFLKIKVKSKSN